ncbi:hypothetical protein BH20ACT5_BH20ACT5_23170 [soil metagenome]
MNPRGWAALNPHGWAALNPRGPAERGSAGVWLLALCAVLVLVSVAGVLVATATVARHRANAAADLAALAAAARVLDGEPMACGLAAEVATGMGARLDGCALSGDIATVTVVIEVGFGRLGVGQARGHARAGPVYPSPP